MSVLRKLTALPGVVLNWLQFQFLETKFSQYPTIRGILVIGGRGKLVLGKKVSINSSYRSNPVGGKNRTSFHIASGAEIVIRNNIGISNSIFYAWESITIEDDVLIGGGCQIYDTDFHSIGYEDRILNGDNKVKTAPVVICRGAFIGTSTIILKGVTIGERSIIAAGSVVVKSVPPDEIWGGNPCRFIRKLG